MSGQCNCLKFHTIESYYKKGSLSELSELRPCKLTYSNFNMEYSDTDLKCKRDLFKFGKVELTSDQRI